jgi:hypothetical protein
MPGAAKCVPGPDIGDRGTSKPGGSIVIPGPDCSALSTGRVLLLRRPMLQQPLSSDRFYPFFHDVEAVLHFSGNGVYRELGPQSLPTDGVY